MERILRPFQTTTATVANAETTSSTIDKREYAVVGVGFPAALEGTTVGWQMSADGTTWFTYYEDDAAFSETVGDDSGVAMPAGLAPWPYVRFVLGSQTGALTCPVAMMA